MPITGRRIRRTARPWVPSSTEEAPPRGEKAKGGEVDGIVTTGGIRLENMGNWNEQGETLPRAMGSAERSPPLPSLRSDETFTTVDTRSVPGYTPPSSMQSTKHVANKRAIAKLAKARARKLTNFIHRQFHTAGERSAAIRAAEEAILSQLKLRNDRERASHHQAGAHRENFVNSDQMYMEQFRAGCLEARKAWAKQEVVVSCTRPEKLVATTEISGDSIATGADPHARPPSPAHSADHAAGFTAESDPVELDNRDREKENFSNSNLVSVGYEPMPIPREIVAGAAGTCLCPSKSETDDGGLDDRQIESGNKGGVCGIQGSSFEMSSALKADEAEMAVRKAEELARRMAEEVDWWCTTSGESSADDEEEMEMAPSDHGNILRRSGGKDQNQWETYWSDEHQKEYYYNPATNRVVWTIPPMDEGNAGLGDGDDDDEGEGEGDSDSDSDEWEDDEVYSPAENFTAKEKTKRLDSLSQMVEEEYVPVSDFTPKKRRKSGSAQFFDSVLEQDDSSDDDDEGKRSDSGALNRRKRSRLSPVLGVLCAIVVSILYVCFKGSNKKKSCEIEEAATTKRLTDVLTGESWPKVKVVHIEDVRPSDKQHALHESLESVSISPHPQMLATLWDEAAGTNASYTTNQRKNFTARLSVINPFVVDYDNFLFDLQPRTEKWIGNAMCSINSGYANLDDERNTKTHTTSATNEGNELERCPSFEFSAWSQMQNDLLSMSASEVLCGDNSSCAKNIQEEKRTPPQQNVLTEEHTENERCSSLEFPFRSQCLDVLSMAQKTTHSDNGALRKETDCVKPGEEIEFLTLTQECHEKIEPPGKQKLNHEVQVKAERPCEEASLNSTSPVVCDNGTIFPHKGKNKTMDKIAELRNEQVDTKVVVGAINTLRISGDELDERSSKSRQNSIAHAEEVKSVETSAKKNVDIALRATPTKSEKSDKVQRRKRKGRRRPAVCHIPFAFLFFKRCRRRERHDLKLKGDALDFIGME